MNANMITIYEKKPQLHIRGFREKVKYIKAGSFKMGD